MRSLKDRYLVRILRFDTGRDHQICSLIYALFLFVCTFGDFYMKLFVPWQQPSSLDNHRDTGPEIDSTFSKLFENLTLEVTTRSACHFLPCRLLKSN